MIHCCKAGLLSYQDTQLSRLGSPNFHQIPINAPKCPFANQQRDGHMQMERPAGRVAYEPNSLSSNSPRETPAKGFHSAGVTETGEKGRIRAESFADHYSQARQFYLSQSPYEQAHIVSALVFELSKVEHPHIRLAMVGHLRHIEEDLAKRVAAGLALSQLPVAPIAAAPVKQMKPSPALQLIGKMKATLEGRAIGILIADGSDGFVIKKIKKAATGAGATVKIIAPKVGGAKVSPMARCWPRTDNWLAHPPCCSTLSPSSSLTKEQRHWRWKAPRSISCAMLSAISRPSPWTKAARPFWK